MRLRVLDLLITDEVREADVAIASARRSLRTLQARFDQLRRKANKSQLERNELILLAGQISSIQQDIQETRSSSSGSVRARLDWLEQPTVSETSAPDGSQESAIPTVQVLVADAPIDQGTTIVPDMVTLVTVSPDATNEMAFTDVASAVGRVVAIDILANQPITPNMLVDE
jgi:flagella basal body P-ring formation protein FlgA